MNDLGTFQAGSVLALAVQCVTAAGVPADPIDNPLLTIYDPDGAVALRTRVPSDARAAAPGLFRAQVQLGDAFTDAGLYSVHVQYVDSAAANHAELSTFLVVAGGNAEGAVVGLHPARRQEAGYLVWLTDAGVARRGRNPR